ncbi:MAG: SpoIVB peptidase [Ruminococcaceae bacterium]|nr:SpoIVB peptidase [Oscillospiraceae bacterium]
MYHVRNTKSRLILFLCLIFLLFIALVADCYIRYPAEITIFEGERVVFGAASPSSLSEPVGMSGVLSETGTLEHDAALPYMTDDYTMTVKLLGLLPVRSVTVNVEPKTTLTACGNTVGIKIFTKGLVCVGTQAVQDTMGSSRNLSKEADIRPGDIFLSVNGKPLTDTSQLISIIQSAQKAPLTFIISRDGKEMQKTLQALQTDEGFCLGIWLRDSTAGIGTLTYYNPDTKAFGALGHPIADSDTGTLMPVLSGSLLPTEIFSVEKGERGKPGELKGMFKTQSQAIGEITDNKNQGVFGYLTAEPPHQTVLPVASGSQIKEGEATILSNVDGNTVEEFDVEIQKTPPFQAGTGRDMIIHITDPDLIDKTGGIVQGMSGSPVIQNGRIVGAVTHVFVNDPTRGYGIFIEKMLQNAS